ncbi:MAG: LPS export ABC transporter permease LptG [Magnetococcales bacterium]|nr:LPS export ABC transporter permease LptG [Magnetococcales bacterium]
MSILFRYLLNGFLLEIVKILGVFVGIFFLLDGAEQIRRFSDAPQSGWHNLIWLLGLRMPDFLVQLLPPIVLLATLTRLSRLARLNEITVIRAGGISIYRVMVPFLVGGLIVAGLQMMIQDQVVPRTNQRAKLLAATMENDQSATALTGEAEELWLRDGARVIHAEQTSLIKQALFGVTVFQFDANHVLVSRTDARRAEFRAGQWWLIGGYHYDLAGETPPEPFDIRPWQVVQLEMEQLDRNTPQPEALPLGRLWQFAERLQREGYDPTPYMVVFHRKLADPALILAAILLAFPFALRLHRMGGTTRSVLTGVLSGFLMFVAVALSTALGLGGRLPPLVAAWAPVLFFVSLAGVMLLHLEEQTRG